MRSALLILLVGCDAGQVQIIDNEVDPATDPTGSTTPTSGTTPTTTTEEGPVLTVVVEGSLEDRSPNDSLASQTPDPYSYGLRRLELMQGPDDPNPALIFDYGDGDVLVDMRARNDVASVNMVDLPSAAFTHARIALTWVEVEVDATVHDLPVVDTWTAPLQLHQVLSDQGDDRQGDVTVSGQVGGFPLEVSQHWPLIYSDPGPGMTVESLGGETLLTFTLAQPILTSPDAEDTTATMRFFIAESFRWLDAAQPGYAEDQWDVPIVGLPELVMQLGANAFEVEVTPT